MFVSYALIEGGGKIKKFIRINDQVRSPTVRLIGPEGEQLGVVIIQRARELADQYELDLVEVAAGSQPPVCRIMNFSKYKYEQEKREKEAKKHSRQSHLKEIRVKPNIKEHDYQVKLKHIQEFLKKGDKVKISLFFRGRELSHPEMARQIMEKFVADVTTHGQIEKKPTQEGRILLMVVAPKQIGAKTALKE